MHTPPESSTVGRVTATLGGLYVIFTATGHGVIYDSLRIFFFSGGAEEMLSGCHRRICLPVRKRSATKPTSQQTH